MTATRAELSVIAVGDGAVELAPLLAALDAQSSKDRIELVVVAPGPAHAAINKLLPTGLATSRLIDQTPLDAFAPAKAEGVRAAQAEVVVFTETHAVPDPDWAAGLIEAHARERCAAIGPVVANANPRPLSWANLFTDYGPFLEGGDTEAHEVADVPGHNSSYRRDLLLGYGGELVRMLAFETFLHDDLRRRGERLVLEPSARIAHVNVTQLRSWLPERWHAGRIYAGARSRSWSRGRRMLYALGSPAIPLLRITRTWRDARNSGHGSELARALPFVVAGLVMQSLAEGYGYWRGPGSMTQLFDQEMRRFDYLAADDAARRHRDPPIGDAAAAAGAGGGA